MSRMVSTSRIVAALTALAAAAAATAPAPAQYANEYVPPKLVSQGKTTQPIAGSGTVIVQVQVNANGSHKVVRVLKSTNSGDNAAAMDIASRSRYRTARKGTKPVTAYYDFTLKFHGKSVASSLDETVASSGQAGQIDRMIRAGNYSGAQSAAQSALRANPNDVAVNEELGTADFFLKDYSAATAAFDKAGTVSAEFKNVAAQAYALAASKLSSSDPQQAIADARKAIALSPNGGAYYALGSAELNAGDTAAAVADLKKAHDLAFADTKADTGSRVAIDTQLYGAYVKAGNKAAADATAAEIVKLDPSAASKLQVNSYMTAGNTAAQANDHQAAYDNYLKAAQAGAVTAYAPAALQYFNVLQAQKTPATAADYQKMEGYADKALAGNPNDALGLFAKGIAQFGQYAAGGSTNDGLKKQAADTLNKAKAAAQSQGNFSLALNIGNFIKQNIK